MLQVLGDLAAQAIHDYKSPASSAVALPAGAPAAAPASGNPSNSAQAAPSTASSQGSHYGALYPQSGAPLLPKSKSMFSCVHYSYKAHAHMTYGMLNALMNVKELTAAYRGEADARQQCNVEGWAVAVLSYLKLITLVPHCSVLTVGMYFLQVPAGQVDSAAQTAGH